MANVILPPQAPATVFTKINASLSGVITAEIASNFVTDTGASNALVATVTDNSGYKITPVAGMLVTLVLANTLQSGANTLNVNGQGNKSIFNNGGVGNLKTSFAVGYIGQFLYTGTAWNMLNSTY